MGAWGDRPFENDAALDWLAEQGGIDTLRRTLEATATVEPTEYLDSDDGNAAVAAAELVAALLADDETLLPKSARERFVALRGKLDPSDAPRAVRALERVSAGNSELASLWDYAGSEWHTKMRALVARLQQPSP